MSNQCFVQISLWSSGNCSKLDMGRPKGLRTYVRTKGGGGSSLFTSPHKRTRGGGGQKLPCSCERNMYTDPKYSTYCLNNVDLILTHSFCL